MEYNWFKNHKINIFLQWAALVVLLALLCYALWQITYDVAGIRREGLHPTRRGPMFLGQPNPAAQISPSQIQGWMTFRYVNLVFQLPTDYLKSSLLISDSHYPNISIDAFAKEQKKTSALEILLVQQAIANRTLPEVKKAP